MSFYFDYYASEIKNKELFIYVSIILFNNKLEKTVILTQWYTTSKLSLESYATVFTMI